MIEVVDHDPSWAGTFADLRDRYAAALAGVPTVAIEHVGSTSVPGLAAKPVIDVDVIVRAEHLQAAIAALEAIGLVHRGDLGVPGRHALGAPAGWPRTNTYVCVDGCLSVRNHLAVRDVLRADAGLRDRYAAVKRRLAAEVDDVDAYVEGKSAVLREVLARAGITAEELDQIEDVNRR